MHCPAWHIDIYPVTDIASPIVSAPMAYATTPALVAAVINAGGLGVLGAGIDQAAVVTEVTCLILHDDRK